MGKLLHSLFGLLHPNAASTHDAPAASTAPALIPGAHAAKELCMLPIDPPAGRESLAMNALGQRLVQFKGDGIRALCIDGRIVSREGAPLDCALHCQPGLARVQERFGAPLVFDGEYIAQDGFDATLTEHKRGNGAGVFWCFDLVPLRDWQAGRCDVAIEDRLELLRELIAGCDSAFVGMFEPRILTPAAASAWAREIWAAGGEGIVSKRLGSPYVRDRSPEWMRFKQVRTVDATIVDVAARPNGTLKSMIVRTSPYDGDGVEKPIVVGTGWSEAEGRKLVAMHGHQSQGVPDEPVRTWVEISFQLSTGAKRTVRGARFHRIRAAKGASA